VLVSVIIPVHNAEEWLEECLESVVNQKVDPEMLEVSIVNDCSTDRSSNIIQQKAAIMKNKGIRVIYTENNGQSGRGCGYAKNKAIKQSSGDYLCFLDADDIMKQDKIQIQLHHAQTFKEPVLIGSNFERIPADSTQRFTQWHQSLSGEKLRTQRFREITLAHPTWFMHREVWERVGGYDESFPGCPEDMIFFYKWIELDGKISKVPETLTVYRWHKTATSYSIHRNRLMQVKVAHFEAMILSEVHEFTIWSVGRDGKKFFMSLSDASKNKVKAFCDVTKIGTDYMDHKNRRKIPIIHFSDATPIVAVCVALNRGLANGEIGEFEKNLATMNWTEGTDYWHLV